MQNRKSNFDTNQKVSLAVLSIILSRHEKMWVLRERKLTNEINAGYLYSYGLETTLVYQFCCRCSRAKHAAKQGWRYRYKV